MPTAWKEATAVLRTSIATTSERGALLLETMLALSLTALLLSGVYTTVVRATEARTRAAVRSSRDTAARAALLSIASDVEAALSPDPTRPVRRFAVTPPVGDAGSATLRFAAIPRAGELPSPGGDARVLALRVRGEPPDGVLTREATSLFAPEGSATTTDALLTSVRRFTVRCLGEHGWQGAWNNPALPRAVEVGIEIDGGGGYPLALAITAVPALAAEAH